VVPEPSGHLIARVPGVTWKRLAKVSESVSLSGEGSYEEVEASLFCTEEEADAAVQAMLEDDPEGEKGTPYERVRAEQDSQQPRDVFEMNDRVYLSQRAKQQRSYCFSGAIFRIAHSRSTP
jgi:hypothetical protein